MGIFDKIKQALSATAAKLRPIVDVFTKSKLDSASLTEIEEMLISADFGVKMSSFLAAEIGKARFANPNDNKAVVAHLHNVILRVFQNKDGTSIPTGLQNLGDPFDLDTINVVVMCGINGSGKTTTIGKLAALMTERGYRVSVAACDTFRAAAVAQLVEWCKRSNCDVTLGENAKDPASVVYTAIQKAKKDKYNLLIVDTAGRMHNQNNLMLELQKIINIIKKNTNGNILQPANVLLSIDATSGQNAFNQVEKFAEIAGVTGLVVTKLDGSAKAGMLIGIVDKFKLPICFACVGEKINDICEFSPEGFVSGIIATE